ncbi:MAG: DNA polymerase sliding clamp [Thermoplasmataceae archaeon]
MKLKISVKNLKEVADLLNTIVSEAKFSFKKDGVIIKAVDPAHVAMVSLEIPTDVFEMYELDQEEEISLDIERLKSILKLANSGDVITVYKEKERLKFEIGTIIKTLSLLDNNSITTPRVPQVSSESYVVLPKFELEKGLKAAEDVSDSIRLTLSSNDFRARSLSDTEESEMVLSRELLKEIKCEESVKSSYPLDYLLKLVKSLSSTDSLKMSFKDDYPLTLDFEFGQPAKGSVGSYIKGVFLLAPRMEQ